MICRSGGGRKIFIKLLFRLVVDIFFLTTLFGISVLYTWFLIILALVTGLPLFSVGWTVRPNFKGIVYFSGKLPKASDAQNGSEGGQVYGFSIQTDELCCLAQIVVYLDD